MICEHHLVSIILPAYNAEIYIRQTINSVLEQTYKNWELIIIDDGSNDNTLKIAQSYLDSRVRVYTQDNSGLAYTLNRGLLLSKGQYIARIDADDICTPDRIRKQLQAITSCDGIALVCSNVEFIDEYGYTTGYSYSTTSSKTITKKLKYGNFIFHPTVMFMKEKVLSLGGYDEKLGKYFEDYLLWVKLSRCGRILVLPEHLVKYRQHSLSISSSTPIEITFFMNKFYQNGVLTESDYIEISNLKFSNSAGVNVKNIGGGVLLNQMHMFFLSIIKKSRYMTYCISIIRGLLNK